MSNIKKILVVLVYLILSIVLFVTTAEALHASQKKDIGALKQKSYERIKRRAADYYSNFAYAKGLEVYKKALNKKPTDDTLKLAIADGFFQTHELDSAAHWYRDVIAEEGLVDDDRHYIQYAETLIHQARYEEAKVWFEKFETNNPEDNRVKARLEGLQKQLSFRRDSVLFEIWNAPFNTAGYDFSPTFYKGGVMIVSSRATAQVTQFLKPKYKWDQSYFLNLFEVDANNEVTEFDKRLKTSYHEGPVAFYDQGTKVIFTRNSYEKGELRVSNSKIHVQGSKVSASKTGAVKLKLFYSELLKNEKWATPVPLSFNDTNVSSGHPTVSADGKKLYFASDREGGFGGIDLYVSTQTDSIWEAPVNMGASINTEGDEMFPFIDEEGIFYFASNGHMGLGGLDIFYVDLNQFNAKPKNMGYPMNTASDDFGLTIKPDGSDLMGYFSSNRPGGKGLDDIYGFHYTRKKAQPGRVVDLITGLPLEGAEVLAITDAGDTLGRLVTSADGTFSFPYEWNSAYTVSSTKDKYSRDFLAFTPADLPEGDVIELRITKELLVIKGVTYREQNNQELGAVKVIVKNENTGAVFGMTTEANGAYSFLAEPNTTYSFLMKKYRYLSFANDLTTGSERSGEIINNGSLTEIVIGKPIELNDIHFDVAKWNIREDAALELDKFTQKLNDNPSIIVELSTHTDSRGGDRYNLDLSDKRAKSSADYVTAHGISAERLVGRGYGESRLLNGCSNGVKCSKEQHQKNRRAEFKVTGFLPEKMTEEELYILWISPDYRSVNLSIAEREELAMTDKELRESLIAKDKAGFKDVQSAKK
ncbi:OmpA family protein [Reichenbachiella carrageenanivorans]|uniref:OmpA family protein n=1 Tax=Reichenbachiella carrageenanivorans TaxID=2979869 RepID=A0ABY6D0K4_9BACT|nr:OmpA family protein [Reichenbachiella carrageenanivorans]UXX79705.1 OmpA family protein [Reichenbachiella carrageenanivorans]